MTSKIDPTKPADGAPAIKGDLRNNLQAAKSEIEALQAAGGAEPTTASNVGEGAGLFSQKTGSNLEFKTLRAGTNMAINLVNDTLELAAATSGGSSAHLIDVRNDFGAAGDGSTDDTEAIQKALEAAPSNGAIIFFPRGDYRVTSPLVIPSVASGVIKPVRIEGENASVKDGNGGGWAGGASTILYEGSGTCIDAYSAAPHESSLSPTWPGSIRNISIHGDGGGTIGLEANDIRSAVFENVLFRGFEKNLKIRGEYFYARFDGLYSYRGQCDFNHDERKDGGGPKANGTVFHRCIFSHGPSDGAFKTGQTQWAGQHLKFSHCWFEHVDTVAVAVHKAGQVIFDQCYFEDKDGGQHLIDYKSVPGGVGMLVLNQCYVRMTNDGCAVARVQAGNSSSDTAVVIRDLLVAEAGSDKKVVLKHSDWPAPINLHSENGQCENTCPLFSGTLSDLASLYTRNCKLAADWSETGGNRSCIKGDWATL